MDERLISFIQNEEAVAFVGAGASADLGLPTWSALAQRALGLLKDSHEAYPVLAEQLAEKDYPGFFEGLFKACGEARVLDFLRVQVNSSSFRVTQGSVHQLIAGLPFRFYLTTNYDNHLEEALKETGLFFELLRNSREELATIAASSRNIIVKLHGDLVKPSSLVLRSSDYRKLKVGGEYTYYRQKLLSLVDMFPIVFIGYSVTDPDITLILETIAETFHAGRPAFGFFADISRSQEERLFREFNLVAIRYTDIPGNYSALRTALRTISRFVYTREKVAKSLRERVVSSAANSDQASMLNLFTNFQVRGESIGFKVAAYRALSLNAISKAPGPISEFELHLALPFRAAETNKEAQDLVTVSLTELQEDGLIICRDDGKFEPSPKGRETADRSFIDRETVIKHFRGQSETDFLSQFPKASKEDLKLFSGRVLGCVNSLFSTRGLEIAGMISGLGDIEFRGAGDLFLVVKTYAQEFLKRDHGVFFLEYLPKLFAAPTEHQLAYLWQTSQTYFAYHALNLDPTCRKFQLELLKDHSFVLDSHLLIAALAKGSFNNQYAADIFRLIGELKPECCATRSMLHEVAGHIRWAIAFVAKHPAGSPEFLKLSLGLGGYRQNLFIDGFIASAAKKPGLAFSDYIDAILKGNDSGVIVKDPQLLFDAVQSIDPVASLTAEEAIALQLFTDQIQQIRVANGSFTRPEQCMAEAEILTIKDKGHVENKNLIFISQSRVLERVGHDTKRGSLVWSPEAFYRYLLCFSGNVPAPNIWHQCLMSDLFQSGMNIIDSHSYRDFFKGQVQQAKLDFTTEKAAFSEICDKEFVDNLQHEYDDTPELQKPLFVASIEQRLVRMLKEVKVLTDDQKRRLALYESRERDRKEFIRKQRENQKKRTPKAM